MSVSHRWLAVSVAVVVVVLPASGEVPSSAGADTGPRRPAELRAAPAAPARRPNILLIVTDDQPVGTISVMKATRRWFKAAGRSYPRALVTTPLCCPSRATLFTGRYAHNHGVRTNFDGDMLGDGTIQRILGDAGYETALVGKYLNLWPLTEAPPHFDRFTLFEPRYFRSTFNVDGDVRTIPGYSTDVLASRAVSYLRAFEARDRLPWFLYVAPLTPHGPHTPAPAYEDARVSRWNPGPAVFEADRTDKPSWVQAFSATPRRGRRIRRQQLRMLLSADDMVARVMKALGQLGERRRTLAIYTSDNGYFWAQHGLNGKAQPYTAAVRVPLFLRWPDRIEPGADRRRVLNVDVAPTVLDAAEVPPLADSPMDGRSLLEPFRRDTVFMEHFQAPETRIPGWFSIRTRHAQYVEYVDASSGGVIFREYYDLAADPSQLTNLLGDQNGSNDPSEDKVAALSAAIAEASRCEGTAGPGACP